MKENEDCIRKKIWKHENEGMGGNSIERREIEVCGNKMQIRNRTTLGSC